MRRLRGGDVKPGTLFAPRRYSKASWKRLVDDDGIVHEGRMLFRTVYGEKAARTNLYRPRCNKTVVLTTATEAALNCFACLVLETG